MSLSIDGARLLGRLAALGEVGRDGEGRLARLAASNADKAGRDLLCAWLAEAGLRIAIDRIGNIFGIWPGTDAALAPVLAGSHIDSVIDAGRLDGCYGVLAALDAIQVLRDAGIAPRRGIAVAAFTNEEGVRFAPDMMGSLVMAGGLAVEDALATIGTDGAVLGAELARIGYAGPHAPGFLRPHAYVELHIEQGPVLETEGVAIGAVANLQGISWQSVIIDGVANHAGTTPMAMRRDAGQAAARVMRFLADYATPGNAPTVATVGCMAFSPNAINVIPSRATFTVDLRDPDEDRLHRAEAALAAFLDDLVATDGFAIRTERLARFSPVLFDAGIVRLVEAAATQRGLSVRRMTSGAGHDAQMMAPLCPAAMIFVPSAGGISHNPAEHTPDDQLVAGANVLLDVLRTLAET